MPTPHLYSQGHEPLFAELAPELQTTDVPVYFVTDRAPETDDQGARHYGSGRSRSLAYGEATVSIEGPESWAALARTSRTGERGAQYTLALTGLREIGRAPPTPFPYTPRGGFYDHDAGVMARVRDVGRRFHAELDRRLALTPRKEVLIYVHGYNNSFRDATLTWAGMWHFFGREGVPVVYSWPAGRGGLTGYAYDRESGEFTVHHLKMMLRAIAENPQVEGLRILAHSRGTDVIATALRELFIESRAAGVDPLQRFRIRQLVLAAPDLDFDVTMQRLVSEPIAPGVGQLTVYVSPTDKAIGIAEWLFGSVQRIGRLRLRDLVTTEFSKALPYADRPAAAANTTVVQLQGSGGSYGHTYFYENPAVSSDVLLALRYDRAPGARNGRPLIPQQRSFWLIEDDYLRDGPGP
jgi:esterase/lipase superfamily enzyme